MATLTVGQNSGFNFLTINAAVNAAAAGDTIAVQAGTYTNDFVTTQVSLNLVAVGGLVSMVATVPAPNGKGIIVADNDLSVTGFVFSGATDADNNGAGIRQEFGNLTVTDCLFKDNQDGMLVNGNPSSTTTIRHSEFSHNGAGDGYSHNIYVNGVKSLTIDDSYFHDAVVGHEIKSRALSTTITNSRIQDNTTGSASYDIDLPNGGVALIKNNTIQKGPGSPNNVLITFGEEGGVYSNSSLTVDSNIIVTDRANGVAVQNKTGYGAVLSNNSVFGFLPTSFVSGTVAVSGTTQLSTRPTLDVSAVTLIAPVQTPTPTPTPVPVPVPVPTPTPVPNPHLRPCRHPHRRWHLTRWC